MKHGSLYHYCCDFTGDVCLHPQELRHTLQGSRRISATAFADENLRPVDHLDKTVDADPLVGPLAIEPKCLKGVRI